MSCCPLGSVAFLKPGYKWLWWILEVNATAQLRLILKSVCIETPWEHATTQFPASIHSPISCSSSPDTHLYIPEPSSPSFPFQLFLFPGLPAQANHICHADTILPFAVDGHLLSSICFMASCQSQLWQTILTFTTGSVQATLLGLTGYNNPKRTFTSWVDKRY